MITYTCPKCGTDMASPLASAGRTETCPQCGNVATVPIPSEREPDPLEALSRASGKPAALKPQRRRAAKPGRKQCPKCKEWIDKNATRCPHCRSKQPTPAWATVLAVVIVLGLGVWGVRSCSSIFSLSPETKARMEQEEAAKAERWKQEEAKQADRRKLIGELITKGVFHKVDFRDGGATVWVDLPFYALDFETKQNFCSVVYAYVSTHARDELVSVTLKDVRSGKTVGDYGQQWTGFGLKMK